MLKRDWKPLATYEGFERIASYVVMFFISIIIVYALVMMGINIFDDFKLGMGFLDAELLKDVFGSLLSILILIEFNHSIALSITRRSGILQARTIVLIAILVIARKVILLDFAATTFEQLLGIWRHRARFRAALLADQCAIGGAAGIAIPSLRLVRRTRRFYASIVSSGRYCSCQSALRMPQPQAKPMPSIQVKYHITESPQ